jgi:hypothetical protein
MTTRSFSAVAGVVLVIVLSFSEILPAMSQAGAIGNSASCRIPLSARPDKRSSRRSGASKKEGQEQGRDGSAAAEGVRGRSDLGAMIAGDHRFSSSRGRG